MRSATAAIGRRLTLAVMAIGLFAALILSVTTVFGSQSAYAATGQSSVVTRGDWGDNHHGGWNRDGDGHHRCWGDDHHGDDGGCHHRHHHHDGDDDDD